MLCCSRCSYQQQRLFNFFFVQLSYMDVNDNKHNWFRETDPVFWPGQEFSLEIDQILYRQRSKYQDILVFKRYSTQTQFEDKLFSFILFYYGAIGSKQGPLICCCHKRVPKNSRKSQLEEAKFHIVSLKENLAPCLTLIFRCFIADFLPLFTRKFYYQRTNQKPINEQQS